MNLELFDESGERVATVEQLTLRSVPVFSLKNAIAKPFVTSDVLNDWLYHLIWEESDLPESSVNAKAGSWLFLADNGGPIRDLRRRLYPVKSLGGFWGVHDLHSPDHRLGRYTTDIDASPTDDTVSKKRDPSTFLGRCDCGRKSR